MKPWMVPWLFPLALVGTVVFVSVFQGYAALVGLPLAWLLIPVLWRAHFPADDDPDADVNYWRLGRR